MYVINLKRESDYISISREYIRKSIVIFKPLTIYWMMAIKGFSVFKPFEKFSYASNESFCHHFVIQRKGKEDFDKIAMHYLFERYRNVHVKFNQITSYTRLKKKIENN